MVFRRLGPVEYYSLTRVVMEAEIFMQSYLRFMMVFCVSGDIAKKVQGSNQKGTVKKQT